MATIGTQRVLPELPQSAPPPSREAIAVVRDLGAVPAWHRGGVVTIGNFDGVHLGHRALVDHARAVARTHDAPVAVLAPDPHPTCFFKPETAPFQLSPGRMKLRLFAEAGIDVACLPRFDRSFAAMSPEDFVAEVLIGALDARHVVVGYDFRFGAGRKGDAGLLRQLMRGCDRRVSVIEPQFSAGDICSSSRIRALIEQGRMENAGKLLGGPWRVGGMATLDRIKGNPPVRARLPLGRCLSPAPGHYAITATIAGAPAQSGTILAGTALVRDTASRTVTLTLPEIQSRHLPALVSIDVAFQHRL